nr:reverse transcriptase domain-containing protein [Tanacetum cinerariifolium]
MVRDGYTAYTDRFHKLDKLVPHLVTPEFKGIDSAILKAEVLIDDAMRNGLLKRSSEKRKENNETGYQKDARSNNKKALEE